MEAMMKVCGVSVLSLVDINNPIMTSQQSTTTISTPNDGDIVSWGKGIALELKKRLSSCLETGTKEYDSLVASGAEMIRLQEEGETVRNLINSSEEIDMLWPTWDTVTRNNHVSELILQAMKTKGCRFIKAVDDGADGAKYTENSKKVAQGRVLAKLRGKTKTRMKEIDPFSPDVVRGDDWASPAHTTQSSFTGGTETERECIIACMEYYKVESPRPFQVEAIHSIVYGDSKRLLLVRKTGEGKSIVFLAAQHLLMNKNRGITLAFYPLKALGFDQEQKAVSDLGMEAVAHVDLLSPDQFNQLTLRLKKVIEEQEYPGDRPIILMLSSASVSRLKPLIEQLLVKKRISFVFIDEAHLLPEDGLAYRSDLLKVKDNLLQHLPPDTHVLAATATMTYPIYSSLQQVTGLKFDKIMWGPMHRRRIYIRFEPVARNNRKKRMQRIISKFIRKNSGKKVLVFSNSAKAVTGLLEPTCMETLESLKNEGLLEWDNAVYSLVGGEGEMMKAKVVSQFSNEVAEGARDPCLILVATDTAKCGISSKYLRLVLRVDPPTTMEQLQQEAGRTARLEENDGINDTYHIFGSVSGLADLLKRGHHGTKKQKRNEMEKLLEVFQFLLADSCYHLGVERYFSCPATLEAQDLVTIDTHGNEVTPCLKSCSVCAKERASYSLMVKRGPLRNLLLAEVAQNPDRTLLGLCKHLNSKKIKSQVWVDHNAVTANHVHFLVMQLWASTVIVIESKDSTNRNSSNITVTWNLGMEGNLAVMNTEAPWGAIAFE